MIENETIIEKEINGHRYIQFKKLLELGIKHCYTENDLNFSFNKQPEESLKKNIDIVCNDLGFNRNNFTRPVQKHTANTKIVTEKGILPDIYDECDGIITNEKDVPLAITTADCVSVLIYDEKKKVLANIHSGWRGSVRGILQNTINIMEDSYHSSKEDLLFFFFPSICKDCYEVENDVKEAFEDTFDKVLIEKGSIIDGIQKYYLDNEGTLINYLQENGIKKENIYSSHICTRCNKDKLHSYRGKTTEVLGLNITIASL